MILVARANYVIPSTNIILFKDAADDTGVWYESIIVNCLKAFVFVELMQYIYRARSKKIKTVYYVLAVIFAFLNFGVYYGSNRAYIVMTLIATLAVYFYIYPDNKTITLIMLIPVGLICVVTMFVNKQFGVELSDFSASTLSVKTISNINGNIWKQPNFIWSNGTAGYVGKCFWVVCGGSLSYMGHQNACKM